MMSIRATTAKATSSSSPSMPSNASVRSAKNAAGPAMSIWVPAGGGRFCKVVSVSTVCSVSSVCMVATYSSAFWSSDGMGPVVLVIWSIFFVFCSMFLVICGMFSGFMFCPLVLVTSIRAGICPCCWVVACIFATCVAWADSGRNCRLSLVCTSASFEL